MPAKSPLIPKMTPGDDVTQKKAPYTSSSQYRFLVVGGNLQVRSMLEHAGHRVVGDDQPFDIAVFTGGEDISPLLYGETFHKETSVNFQRDLYELRTLREIGYKVPKVGICRGGQLLNVFNGGRMYQDIDGHRGSHKITDFIGGNEHMVTSVHHQMMIPASHAWVLAVASEATKFHTATSSKIIAKSQNKDLDVEAIFYEESSSLCFQPHPEYSGPEDNPTRDLFFQYIDVFLEDVVFPKKAEERKAMLKQTEEQLGINQC